MIQPAERQPVSESVAETLPAAVASRVTLPSKRHSARTAHSQSAELGETDFGDGDIECCLQLFQAEVEWQAGPAAPVCSAASTLDAGSIRDLLPLAAGRVDEPVADVPAERFVVNSVLGVGAFGVVLHAHDRQLDLPVALKLLRPSRRHSQQLQRRFLREAQAAAALNHPGIVRVYETGRINGHAYIMAGLVNGPSLATLLRERGGRLDQQQAARLVAEVAEAVQYAHERGVLHRDLKPSNILLEPAAADGQHATAYHTRLTDFGLARRVNHLQDRQDNLSDGCRTLGTLRYMSPEQASGRMHDVGIAADIYSLGAILYQALAGQTPHEGTSSEETLTRILRDTPVSLRQLNATIHPDLDNIVLKCLMREPHERYASAGELAADLQRFLRGDPVQARRAGAWRRLRYWARQNPVAALMSTVAATSIVLAMISVSVLYVRERQAVVQADITLGLTLQAFHEAYQRVAEEVLSDVPNTAARRYQLHRMSIESHRQIAEHFGFDVRSRYRLSVAHHYASVAADQLYSTAAAEQHRHECIALLLQLQKEDPDNHTYQYDLFYNRKLQADRDTSSDIRDRVKRKERVHADILRLLHLVPDKPEYLDAAASSKLALALDCRQFDQVRARQLLQEAWEISDRLWAEYPDRLLLVKYALVARACAADLQRDHGELAEAEQLCRDACRILQAIQHPERDELWFAEVQRAPLRSLAESCLLRQKWPEAADLLRQCIAISRRLVLHSPQHDGLQLELCQYLTELLRTERWLGLPPNAELTAELDVLLTECAQNADLTSSVQQLRLALHEDSIRPLKAGR